MVWTIAHPGAGQANAIWSDFWAYRSLHGNVQMRLTDVSLASGKQWSNPASLRVNLIDRDGTTRGGSQLLKNWGVTPGYVTLAIFGTSWVSCRMRCRPDVTAPPEHYNEGVTWTSDLRYGTP